MKNSKTHSKTHSPESIERIDRLRKSGNSRVVNHLLLSPASLSCYAKSGSLSLNHESKVRI